MGSLPSKCRRTVLPNSTPAKNSAPSSKGRPSTYEGPYAALDSGEPGSYESPTIPIPSNEEPPTPICWSSLSADNSKPSIDKGATQLAHFATHQGGGEVSMAEIQRFNKSLTAVNAVRRQLDGDQVVSSPMAHAGGFFSNGNGFVFNNPVMKEVHEYHGPQVLEKMKEHIILGAEHNSSYRDDPPRCHPNTRTHLLEQLQTRIHDTNLITRIIWLVGPAGVGKSAIMQSLAEVICPLPTLTCATLFLSRPNRRDDPKKVFVTLAHDFAVADEAYRRYMGGRFTADPMYLDRSLDEQFNRIFILPFTSGSVNFGSRRWVVFSGGLDECDGGKEQQRIIDLIRESIHHHAQATPLKRQVRFQQ